jgi:hypothetical protein
VRHGVPNVATLRQQASTERQGARHDPLPGVEDLDPQLTTSGRGVQRACGVQESGGRHAEAGDVARAVAQGVVERRVQLVVHDQHRGCAEQDDRHEDRGRRGGDQARPQ